jgi:hypothetical protein
MEKAATIFFFSKIIFCVNQPNVRSLRVEIQQEIGKSKYTNFPNLVGAFEFRSLNFLRK